jgi:hypothetical protein
MGEAVESNQQKALRRKQTITMAESGNNSTTTNIPKDKQQEFIQKVADRVWQLWREELRREHERLGKFTGR